MKNRSRVYSFFFLLQKSNCLPLHKAAEILVILVNSIADPSFTEFFFKIFQKIDLISTRQHSFSFFTGKLNHLIDWHPVIVDQPCADHKESPPPASMAMHTDLPLVDDQNRMKNVHDSHHMLESCTCHVFPTFAEALDAVMIKVFRNIAEPHMWYDSVSTIRMLT